MAEPAGAALSCPNQALTQPFVPWLDFGSYVLPTNGALESTAGWKLSGGAALAAVNEPWHVTRSTDRQSLSLPPGSSAVSPPLCITLLHPTLRFFASNSGSALSPLRVDAISSVLGISTTIPVGFVLGAGGVWMPTLPMAFLDNLTSPVGGSVSFRFTPVGSGGAWRIDDVYVDPFKDR